MSLHVRNLQRGDVFSSPKNLSAYGDFLLPYDAPHYRWKVINVKELGQHQRRVIAHVLGKPWIWMNQVVNRDVSLGEVDEDVPWTLQLKWVVSRLARSIWPDVQYLTGNGPGHRKLADAISIYRYPELPLMPMVYITYVLSKSQAQGGALQVEDLSNVMRAGDIR